MIVDVKMVCWKPGENASKTDNEISDLIKSGYAEESFTITRFGLCVLLSNIKE